MGTLLFATLLLASCTTFVRPTTCVPGSTSCGGISDARFCEYTVLAVEGEDCAHMGISVSRPFCVVTPVACIDTNYALRDYDCRVLRYERVQDSARANCPPDAPTFVNRESLLGD
jgi:hypothetical protein